MSALRTKDPHSISQSPSRLIGPALEAAKRALIGALGERNTLAPAQTDMWAGDVCGVLWAFARQRAHEAATAGSLAKFRLLRSLAAKDKAGSSADLVRMLRRLMRDAAVIAYEIEADGLMEIPASLDKAFREVDQEASRALTQLQRPGRRISLERDLIEALMPLYQQATGEPVTRNGPSLPFLQAAVEIWRTAIQSCGLRTTFPQDPEAAKVSISTAVRSIKLNPTEQPWWSELVATTPILTTS